MRTVSLSWMTESWLWTGTPREIFSRVKELKEYRLDVPQVTELAYELKQAGVDLPDGILTMDELMEKLLPILHEKFPEVK